MFKIFKYLKKRDGVFILLSLLFIFIQVWLDLKIPDYMSEITTILQTQESTLEEILISGGYMVLCALGSLVATFIVGYLVAKIAAGLSMRLREAVYDKTMSFSMEEMSTFSTASLITRSTNDITQIQTFVAMGLQAIVKAPIMATWAILKIAGKGWQWSATTGVAVIVLVLMLAIMLTLAMPKFTIVQKLTDNLNRTARENLAGIRVVRAYNAEHYQEQKFEKANEELTAVNIFTQRVLAIMQPGMRLIMSGLTLAIYWVGVYMIDAASMADKLTLFSDMVVFSSYAMQVIMAFMLLSMTFIILPRAVVSASRINEVLDTEVSIIEGTVEHSEIFEHGEVEFKNVSFRYPGAADYVLKDINFTVHKGEIVAFIGSTGSGKSTLINLIPRFYDASEGAVIVDGIDVRNYKLETLYNKIGYVPQQATLFSGTITSNVSYGENGKIKPTFEDIQKAIEIAQAKEFVEEMDGTYDASISQGGTNISGGQKQRLSIARAICRRPEIFIFDDSFSALDYKTDRQLRNQLNNEIKHTTCFIVAQRIGTIMDADQIIVLDKGEIVGKGTHKELLKTCPVYLQIAQSQLTKEEIENA